MLWFKIKINYTILVSMYKKIDKPWCVYDKNTIKDFDESDSIHSPRSYPISYLYLFGGPCCFALNFYFVLWVFVIVIFFCTNIWFQKTPFTFYFRYVYPLWNSFKTKNPVERSSVVCRNRNSCCVREFNPSFLRGLSNLMVQNLCGN